MSPRISRVYDDHEEKELGFLDEDEPEFDQAAYEDEMYERWSDE